MKEERPYVTCLMMTSVDGKILGEKWGNSEKMEILRGKFEQIHEEIGIKAWIVGRTSMEKDFTDFAKPVIKDDQPPMDRNDYVGKHDDSGRFAIALDGKAKLGWAESTMQGDHVITILTEQVKDGYLAHLQDIGVSYIFAGKNEIDLTVALNKLRSLFGIEKLMLEGGARINGSFLQAGLIDELHQLLLPIADGGTETSSIFEIDLKDKTNDATLMKLKKVKQIEDDVLWLNYIF
ncbi:RibD family protein [Pedobacter sp. CFBP9032]|uniref:RibD family protein n=1 Tax=Pedobacter sp. CFBP9032 TaxID=3096539 RepID=UPI002A6B42B5|nr:RibD family protein [Pedobacter sp. CFBP9032]MDY0906501.1 RibD family protein [Pedobacter sp. CFBP9032]